MDKAVFTVASFLQLLGLALLVAAVPRCCCYQCRHQEVGSRPTRNLIRSALRGIAVFRIAPAGHFDTEEKRLTKSEVVLAVNLKRQHTTC